MTLSQYSVDNKSIMSRLNITLICVFVVYLAIAEAGSRVRRSPQFGQASASATAFGGNRYPPGPPGIGGPGFGRPGGFGQGGNFGGGNFGPPGGNFGGPGNFGRPTGGFGGPGFGRGFGPSRPGGLNVNIAKSVSISSGRGGLSSASAQSRG